MNYLNMNKRIIQKSQNQYFDLIKSFEKLIFSDEINQKQIAMIMDEVQAFWSDKKNILSFELENLTSERKCFLLSGATYLNVNENEHYFFKALGDEHIISDPLLKLENFFRVPSHVFDIESITIFKRAYSDMIEILSNYQNIFYILPMGQIAIPDQKEHNELLNNFYLKFVGSVLNENFENFNEFFEKYRTYDEIDKNLTSFFRANLIFEEYNNEELSLGEKIESYINSHSVMITLTQNQSESRKFILALQNYVAQIIDILLISSFTNVTPFIRFKPTFHYLTLVMYTFIENENYKKMIEMTIVFYIFYNTINKEKLIGINFNHFVKISQKNDFLNKILEKVRALKIDIFSSGINEVTKIIEEIFVLQKTDTTIA